MSLVDSGVNAPEQAEPVSRGEPLPQRVEAAQPRARLPLVRLQPASLRLALDCHPLPHLGTACSLGGVGARAFLDQLRLHRRNRQPGLLELGRRRLRRRRRLR